MAKKRFVIEEYNSSIREGGVIVIFEKIEGKTIAIKCTMSSMGGGGYYILGILLKETHRDKASTTTWGMGSGSRHLRNYDINVETISENDKELRTKVIEFIYKRNHLVPRKNRIRINFES